MRGLNGVQCQVHPRFLDLLHEIQNERIKQGLDSKSGENALSTKRLSLTIYKLFKTRPDIYVLIVNATIDKKES
jgi:hypothetical protein